MRSDFKSHGAAVTCAAVRVLLVRLHQADNVVLGIGEQRYRGTSRDILGAHHTLAAESLDLAKRRLDVGDMHVERDVAFVAFFAATDPAADAAVFSRMHDRVVWSAITGGERLDLPIKCLLVEVLQRGCVFSHDLEMKNWITHLRLLISFVCFLW